MDAKTKEWITKLPEPKKTHAKMVREIVLSSSKEVTESLKWGQLTFSLGKKNIAFIYTYKQADYMNLGFMHAVKLADPKNLFEGTGKGMRHIKIRTKKDIPVTQIKKWVKESIALFEGE